MNFEHETNLETEKKIVQSSNEAQINYYNAEMEQKIRRKQQMAENINASMRMRQEQDNELANKVLTNEQKINRLRRISPE